MPRFLRSALASRLRALATTLDGASQRDQLTGLVTRVELMRHLRKIVGSDQRPAILYVDLDDFKLVNDTLGHAAGDDLLRHVATSMSELVAPGDLLARQGGDEFVLVCAACNDVEKLADRLSLAGHGRGSKDGTALPGHE